MKFDKTQKRALVFVAGLLGLSWYMGNQFEKADMMRSESDAYTYAYNEGHSDSRKDEGYQPTLASAREEGRFRKILKQRAETFNAPATKKPKLTKTQLEALNMMKASTFYGSGGYAYVEVDNRGWKSYTTRPVQGLLDKGIITIPKDENRRFYGRVKSMEAYIVYLNPVAWKYPFRYDYDKSLSQVGDKIVQNKKIQQQEHARILKQKQDEENMTLEEVLDELFGAESTDMIYVPMSLGSYSCEPEILGIFREEKDAISAIHDSIKEENTEFYHEEDSLIWTDEDGNRWELHIYSERILSGLESYGAETFNAPYAGSGSLMNIGQDTSLGNFTSKELTESSAIHGDFNEASLNYSGHQNLQVRGAEKFDAEALARDWKWKGIGWTPEEEATLSREEKETVAEQLYNDWRAGKIKATDVDEYYERLENGAETMTPSEVDVKVTKDVTPKGSKLIVEECVDIQAHKADATANFYRVRFRDPAEMSNFRVPAWAARAANTMGSKYYDVAGSKVTMGQDKSGNWKIQSVMVPKRANVDVDLALKIANHIQDRLEKEGRWASKKCQDNERVLIIR